MDTSSFLVGFLTGVLLVAGNRIVQAMRFRVPGVKEKKSIVAHSSTDQCYLEPIQLLIDGGVSKSDIKLMKMYCDTIPDLAREMQKLVLESMEAPPSLGQASWPRTRTPWTPCT